VPILQGKTPHQPVSNPTIWEELCRVRQQFTVVATIARVQAG